jgi:uncharacterized protein YgfB (UPF0149 family)
MDKTITLPSYAELTELLATIPDSPDASQTHGLLSGYICGMTHNKDKYRWEQILGTDKNKVVQQALRQLFENSYRQLTEFSFEFSIILPDDEAEINTRAEALGLWCQGFLTGLKHADVDIEQQQGEVAEAFDDFIEIAKVNFGSVAANEEDEEAYLELVEYVRLSALMIFHELRTSLTPQTVESKDKLH